MRQENKKFTAIVLFFCTLLSQISTTSSSVQGAIHQCENARVAGDQSDVKISGRLIRRVVWGPPNFGEHPDTDKKLIVWIVRLDYPLHVLANGDIGQQPKAIIVKNIQIKRRLATAQGYDDLLSRHVVVVGRLLSQVEYDDETPVVIDASVVRVGGRIGCDGSELPPKI